MKQHYNYHHTAGLYPAQFDLERLEAIYFKLGVKHPIPYAMFVLFWCYETVQTGIRFPNSTTEVKMIWNFVMDKISSENDVLFFGYS